MSDAWLLGRARELIAAIQSAPTEQQPTFIPRFDELLGEGRRRSEPRLLGTLLRASAIARLATPSLSQLADPVLDELLTHTRRHGLLVLQADAHALRGIRALQTSKEDAALTEVARALAMLDEARADREPGTASGERTWYRLLSSALVDVALVLTRLGLYEDADPVLARANKAIASSGGPHEIVVQLINRVKLLLGWGLRLERIGHDTQAAERFRTAAAIADAVEHPYGESLFPREPGRAAAEQMPVLAAALALSEPGPRHTTRLAHLLGNTGQQRHLTVLSVALARCLEHEDRIPEALAVLVDARDRMGRVDTDRTEHSLRLSLLREYARLCGAEAGHVSTDALELYITALEAELWTRRNSQIAALAARREHERLFREHGTATKQAMQDPLTGLPNRRALDERLRALSDAPPVQPLSIALIDLDGFKEVNDRGSHAEGDDVLRVVASTVRDTLRGDDPVTRYGGDEFVVLLPGASLHAAEAALGRAVDAVAALPLALSHGVTLSVGVVTLLAHESATSALARADAAMYLAKRRGGNHVVATATDSGPSRDAARGTVGGDESPSAGSTWVLPDPPDNAS